MVAKEEGSVNSYMDVLYSVLYSDMDVLYSAVYPSAEEGGNEGSCIGVQYIVSVCWARVLQEARYILGANIWMVGFWNMW